MDVVVFSVELAQFGLEAVSHLDHDFFAAAQHLLVEHIPPILGHKDQMGVHRGNHVSAVPVFV
ncbi:hypothetical protein H4W81_008303 [Nonomuraea africana]|uniref:Uncharacterized protein n=1 Tax=Nonomuraea africana TaxID=46171 RepID=A0ABR9KU07_9ACTN|nr:hypothetical protein [Nonomuraea africana]